MNVCCDAVAVVARIARRVKLNGVGEEHRALTIHMDAAPFIDDVRALSGYRQDLGDLAGDGIVMPPLELGILAPAVELPVDGDECVILQYKGWSDIAQPGVVQSGGNNGDGCRQLTFCCGEILRVTQHPHRFIFADGIGHR